MTDPEQQELYDQLLELSKQLSNVNRELQGVDPNPLRQAALKTQRASLIREIDELCERIRTNVRP